MKNRTFQAQCHASLITALSAAALAIGGAAIAGGEHHGEAKMKSDDSSMSHHSMAASLSVSDQKITDQTAVIDGVYMPTAGFVVIHAATGEGKLEAPASIGHKHLEKGKHSDVEVSLSEPVGSGDKLFVMLHEDTGKAGEYEFGTQGTQADGAMKAHDKAVIKPFMAQ